MSKRPKATRGKLRYLAYVPRKMRRGKLCHNNVRHTADMLPGAHGFRAWFDVKPPAKFKLCGCGWSGLPHFSTSPDYKCETLEAPGALNLATLSSARRMKKTWKGRSN
jgi:hypothetical protein